MLLQTKQLSLRMNLLQLLESSSFYNSKIRCMSLREFFSNTEKWLFQLHKQINKIKVIVLCHSVYLLV